MPTSSCAITSIDGNNHPRAATTVYERYFDLVSVCNLNKVAYNLVDPFSKHDPMAQLIRSAKSGNDWTSNELAAYNITVVFQDAATFFETPDLPQPAVNTNVLTTLEYRDAPDDDTYRLLRNLDLATTQVATDESAVDDFAVLLLRALGYEPRA